MKHITIFMMCLSILLIPGGFVNAYEITLSLYNQGFDINAFYNNGDFDPEVAIVNADPSSLLVIVGDPANVEEILKVPEIDDPFKLAEGGADFHFEVFQPFRFPDRFDGLFSTTVDNPMLLVLDNLAISEVSFYDDGVLADDRIDLSAYSVELLEFYFEVDSRDALYLTMLDGIILKLSNFIRLDDFTVSFDAAPVPEAGTFMLLGIGLLGLLGALKKRKAGKAFPASLFLAVILVMPMLLFPTGALAYEIGPEFCSSMSVAICGLFQNEYDTALGDPISQAVLTCSLPNGDSYPYPVVDSCPTYYKESWTQYYQNGYIICNDGNCLGYSTAFDPDDPDEPLKHPELTGAESRNSCIKLNNGTYQLSKNDFSYTFDPANPNFTMYPFYTTFSPATVSFPLSDRTMVRDVTAKVEAGEYGSADADVTVVNQDIKWDLSPLGFDLKFKKKMKEMTKAFDTIEETTSKFKRFDLATCKASWEVDPSLSFGFEGSKLCCPSRNPSIKDGLKMYANFSADFGPFSCDIPVFPLPFGFRANLAFDAGLGLSLEIAKEPSCESSDDLCGKVEGAFNVGLGASLTDITGGKILKGSLKGEPNPHFGARVCAKTDNLSDWSFKDAEACIEPKVVGEVIIASFIKKSISLSVGGKRCKTWE